MTRVLDLGCGRSGSKLTGTVAGARVGLDVSLSELREAKRNLPDYLLVCGRGEQLPFPDDFFIEVVCGVALPYMDIRAALGEVARVLEPEGRFLATLHPLSFVLSELSRSLAAFNWQDVGYRIYVILNGILLHCLGVGFHFPFGSKRFESFQTYHFVSRALRKAGVKRVQMYVAARPK
jgi:SAM-dependent methyltransferase